MDAGEQGRGGFVVRVLWHQLAAEGAREDGGFDRSSSPRTRAASASRRSARFNAVPS
ncbi:MAG: hypothetical protein AVDCRST_MAG09-1379 [uncultured Sphingomonas sp.]|uniref:Uncharacterized protein n=1 Tax=uncultured Sphingomonas sp. TaxID=158754 RepID=A0A6J4T269_9SPHN|nr:MAG: hypothetical protein AVDCRST_MAG09-1379 [uncultured Sphingomonas sp.]